MWKPILGGGSAAILGLYEWDRRMNASAIGRNIKTMGNAIIIAWEYKVNFDRSNLADLNNLHDRVAKRIFRVCSENGGLYIKFGQQIATVQVLPPQYAIFRRLYDDAPSVPFSDVQQVFQREFDGRSPNDIFASFDEKPVASASIAQVHQATLKDGKKTKVAVKIQKPQIRKQMEWDLATYAFLSKGMQWLFDLPLDHFTGFVQDHLRQETNFVQEGRNSERAARDLKHMSDVHIPTVFWDLTRETVLTCEWIDGIRMTDIEGIRKSGMSVSSILKTVVDAFSHQIFYSGFVHADPHIGNIIVRDRGRGKPEVVLLDHGLYVESSESFRRNYCRFWQSMFTLDVATLDSISREWGIGDVQLFASATLQRPWRPNQALHLKDHSRPTSADIYDLHMRAKERLKAFLANSERMPKELVFIGRNLNIVRANNKAYGSPVNRINIMARNAATALGLYHSTLSTPSSIPSSSNSETLSNLSTFNNFLRSRWSYFKFEFSLFVMSLGFWTSRFVQYVQAMTGSTAKNSGFEDILDDRLRQTMMEQFGIVIDANAFDA